MAIKIRSGNQWVPVSGGGGEPIGTITVWSGASSNIPDGYRLCDGSFLSRSDFNALFAAIGTIHGAGDGSSTFNIPNLTDKFIVGASDSIGDTTYPGVSPAATGGSADAIVVSHRHTTVNYVGRAGYAEPRNFGVGTDGNANNTGTTGDAQDFADTPNTIGQSGTNKNLPPYYALCYIIKVFNTKITITGSGGGVIVQDQGSALATTATTLNFVGDNVVASGTGSTKTITISSSSGSNVTNSLNITGDEGSDATLNLIADQGDDNADKWRIRSDTTSNDLKFETYYSGSWSDGAPLKLAGNGIVTITGQAIIDKVNINDNVIQLNSGTEDLKVRGNGTGGTYHLNLDDNVSITGDLNIGNNTSSNPFTYLRFGASQFGAADIRPTDESNHKVGLAFYVDGTQDTLNPVEKFRINSYGAIGLNGTNYGTSGKVLTSNGASSAPTWETPAGGGSAPTPSVVASDETSHTVNENHGSFTVFKTLNITPSTSGTSLLVVVNGIAFSAEDVDGSVKNCQVKLMRGTTQRGSTITSNKSGRNLNFVIKDTFAHNGAQVSYTLQAKYTGGGDDNPFFRASMFAFEIV